MWSATRQDVDGPLGIFMDMFFSCRVLVSAEALPKMMVTMRVCTRLFRFEAEVCLLRLYENQRKLLLYPRKTD